MCMCQNINTAPHRRVCLAVPAGPPTSGANSRSAARANTSPPSSVLPPIYTHFEMAKRIKPPRIMRSGVSMVWGEVASASVMTGGRMSMHSQNWVVLVKQYQ